MDASLLDTDLLSELLKERNPSVTTKAAAYLAQHGHFTFSEFSRFEVRRGYLEMKGIETLTEFESFCTNSLVLPVTTAIFDRAAILWAEARAGGVVLVGAQGDAAVVISQIAIWCGFQTENILRTPPMLVVCTPNGARQRVVQAQLCAAIQAPPIH